MSPTSPRQIQIDPNLPTPSAHPRSMSVASPNALSPSRALGPVHLHRDHRSMSIDEQRIRERQMQQMQQDIESAMSMSRARSGSMNIQDAASPVRPSVQHYPSTSPIEEGNFPMLSDAEEADMDRARSGFSRDIDGHSDDENHRDHLHPFSEEEEERAEGMMDHEPRSLTSSGYESHTRLLHREAELEGSHHQHARYDSARAIPGVGVARTAFNFVAMEEYASKERDELARQDDAWAPGVPRRQSEPAREAHGTADTGIAFDNELGRTATVSAYGDDHETAFSPGHSEAGTTQQAFHRRRQRKLSQSNPVLRRGAKLAMFEGFGSNANGDTSGEPSPFKAPRPAKLAQMNSHPGTGPNGGFAPYSDNAPGHDRPYRFSFYSNSLPVTIHSRTLAELPAEGQTFEDLFRGRGSAGGESGPNGTAGGSANTSQRGADTPTGPTVDGGMKQSLLARAANAAIGQDRGKIGPPSGPPGDPAGDDDPEQFTWWLDVLSPTDEEMRMLSKVFGIHPLTTEDILLEETREKIELFRNYYLVCFRSFDQDPYSQTYLEPLNMYIIVFREGTLSFHFRGTPHPQNVRRRIKHLKDYISVTSDWISYALIDDITDAFGPLIQSIEYEVDSIDELVLILKDAEQSDMLRRIGTCRKKVMGLLRLMGNKADVVKGLAKRCNEQWLVAPKSDIGLYLSDIQDHLITMTQNLNHYEKILSRSHSNYLAQISIEMTDANNQINDVLSKLTALGTVLIPMNLVTGLWGMNVHVPGEDITEGYAWFGGILGCLALFAVLGAFATYKCFVR